MEPKPSDNRLVFELPDGTIDVHVLPCNASCWRPVESEWFAAAEAKIRAENPILVGAVRLRDHHYTEIGPWRWRKCWRNDGTGTVRVDMALARAQRMAEIRAERDRRMVEADKVTIEEQRKERLALPNKLAESDLYKQKLCDVPLVAQPLLDACATPEELVAFEPIWPA